ncbi:MAG: hypothetical protein M3N48_13740 [Verrucomicrobiota bacterium]|nr:hypothetical protein [Verrucomicrobiota bacterium]
MNDEILVGEFNSVADFQEKTEPLFNRRCLRTAKLSQRFALDIFHHEIGKAIVGHTAVK